MITLETPLSSIPAFKKTVLGRLKHLGLETVGDLLRHLPRRYEDYSIVRPIGELAPGELTTIEGTVKNISAGRTFRRHVYVTEATIEDATGSVRAVWFGNRFIASTLRENLSVRLSGTVGEDRKGLLFQSPEVERAARDATHTARLIPVYSETAGVTSRFFRWQIAEMFKHLERIPDPLPKEILERLHLPSLQTAFHWIHFPESEEQSLIAHKRFAWDEMFLIQVKALQLKELWEGSQAVSVPSPKKETDTFVARFPFELTPSQKKASKDILGDLALPRPMNRLLNGDVGSGKTAVAMIAAYAVARAGYQSVILAPTEVLARQHYESFLKTFSDLGVGIAFLTREYRHLDRERAAKSSLISAIAAGIPSIVIGTHALLQEGVRFHKLALIIVDEQHRFGVAQRAYLQSEAASVSDGLPDTTPHFLTMTATPIPRTLALSYFGSLDLSLLTDMPANRKPIKTRVAANDADRRVIYDFIRSEIKKGRQAFVIFPLVEESESLGEVKAATAEHKRLSEEVFPDLRLGLLHGRMKAKEKEEVMRDFKDGKYDILVSTSVVEVGIDIPNASVMLIEDADRFGLSQLHQFRGRVGRAEHQSYCFLVPGAYGSAENKRLQALAKHASGFDIAEEDLALRGPGAFFGTRQSGLPDVSMENLGNIRLVELARSEAADLLTEDPSLEEHPLLKAELARFEGRIHLE